MDIGEKIKNMRLKMGLTQEELAERSNLTKGFISQLERDTTSPSVDTLDLIVRALGTSLAVFFEETAAQRVVYSLAEAVTKREDKLGHRMHFIVPTAQQLDMEPVLLEVDPHGRSRAYPPYEGQAFGFLLEGDLILCLGLEEYPLGPNDCFYFEADRRFHVENRGDHPARLLWVLSPPDF